MSPCVGSLRGTAWGSRIFFHQLYPCWVLQPEVVGTYLTGTGVLGWRAWCKSGTPPSQDIPPEFLSTTLWVTGHLVPCLCLSYQSGWMWFLQFRSCQTSVQLDFWCSWVMVVLYLSCNFDVVVWRGEPCLPMSPSWREAPIGKHSNRYQPYTAINICCFSLCALMGFYRLIS